MVNGPLNPSKFGCNSIARYLTAKMENMKNIIKKQLQLQ